MNLRRLGAGISKESRALCPEEGGVKQYDSRRFLKRLSEVYAYVIRYHKLNTLS